MTNTAPYLLAFTLPLVVTALLTPVAGRLARRKGFVEHPEGRKVHHRATPSLGGLAVAAGLAIVGLTVAGASGEIAVLVLGAGAVAVVGLVDDWRDLGPLPKLAVETGAALALWFGGIGAGLFGVPVLDAVLTVLWVLTVTNALNFVDNMDGLASGLSAISAFGFFGIAASQGDYLVASLALATTGAALGFLWHNFPPAKIFLGDAGSLLLGFLLASLGLKLDLVGESGWVRSAIPLLVLAVPLFDMALVVVARVLEGRPVHLGSTDHSSHRLRGRGMSVRDVALASYAVQAVCVVAAFMLYDASWDRVLLGSSLALAVALAALAIMLRTAALPHAVAGEGTPPDTP